MQRSLAKYRLIAEDVEDYRTLTEIEPDKYPPLEELIATVHYEGYFPNEFNVTTGKPVNSITGFADREPRKVSGLPCKWGYYHL